MDIGDFNFKTDFDKQCGEIFLTIKGKMMFHCTLCEGIFKDFDRYSVHVTKLHLQQNSDEIEYDVEPLTHSNTENYIDLGTVEVYPSLEESESAVLTYENSSESVTEVNSTLTNSLIFVEVKDELESEAISELNPEKELETKPILTKIRKHKLKRAHKKDQPKKDITTDRIHKCSICDFSCNDRSNLISHIRRHSSQRPHKCTECSKSFYTRTELNTHLRIHTGDRPFLCTRCGKSFKTAGLLTDHYKRHENIRNKECDKCGKKFYNADMLKRHLAIHSDRRPFICFLCESSFKQSNALRNHMKIHENKLEYKCRICLARFNQKPGLHSHMKSKHSLKPPLRAENLTSDSRDLELKKESSS